MLVETHLNPDGQEPEALAAAVAAAGLDGAIITENRMDRWDAYADAFEAADLVPYLGIEMPLVKGVLVFVPADLEDPAIDGDWNPPGARPWTVESALAKVEGLDGALLASHPYCRDLPSVLGDRVYSIKGLAGLVTRVGMGKLTWDRLADEVAGRRNMARLGSGGGGADGLGRAATVVPAEADNQEDLVKALRAGMTLPVELDDPKNPRDRRPPRPPPREDRGPRGRGDRDDRGGRDRGGRRDGRGGRGGRSEDRGGRGGPRQR